MVVLVVVVVVAAAGIVVVVVVVGVGVGVGVGVVAVAVVVVVVEAVTTSMLRTSSVEKALAQSQGLPPFQGPIFNKWLSLGYR